VAQLNISLAVFGAMPILFLFRPPGQAVFVWLTRVLLGEICLAVILGVAVGYSAGKFLMLCENLRPIRAWGDALFLGWFGPIGIAAVFYGMVSVRHTEIR